MLITAGVFFDEIMHGGTNARPATPWPADLNKKFIKDLAGYEWKTRDATKKFIPDKSMIKSGDVFLLMYMEGLPAVLQIGMGGRVSHCTNALWDTSKETGEEELFIVQSTDLPIYPGKGVQKDTYDNWLQLIDKAGYSVVFLPLSDENSKKFDTAKAWELFNAVEGSQYGYQNMLNSWIDTTDRNLPNVIDIDFLYTVFMTLEILLPKVPQISQMIGESLNKNLGTEGLQYPELAIEAAKQKLSIIELMAIPEKQGLIYSTGQSYVCSTLATAILKAGGVFEGLKILPNEFTPKDLYQSGVYKDASNLPAACKANDPDLPYCQVQGDLLIELDDFNTVKPYSNMNERCPTLAPLYLRDPGC